jgi:hypothetical protein
VGGSIVQQQRNAFAAKYFANKDKTSMGNKIHILDSFWQMKLPISASLQYAFIFTGKNVCDAQNIL